MRLSYSNCPKTGDEARLICRILISIGLTGGFCCGKTTVAGMLKTLGAVVVDADQVAHSVMRRKAVREQILDAFGRDVLEHGEVSRARLAEIVFDGGKERLRTLNSIVHPPVIAQIKKILRRESRREKSTHLLVVDAPLLIEAGMSSLFSKLVVVRADEAVQVRRAVANGLSKAEARARITVQMPLDEKVKLADYVIENGGCLTETFAQVRVLWRRLNL